MVWGPARGTRARRYLGPAGGQVDRLRPT